nr:Rne/Rng family ribonuclease [Antribacter gilvus]
MRDTAAPPAVVPPATTGDLTTPVADDEPTPVEEVVEPGDLSLDDRSAETDPAEVEVEEPVTAAKDLFAGLRLPERAVEQQQAAPAGGIRSLDDIVLPGGPTARAEAPAAPAEEPAAEEPKAPRARRRTKAEPAETPAVTEDVEPAPKARSRRRATTAATTPAPEDLGIVLPEASATPAPAEQAEPASVEPAPAPAAAAEPAAEKPARARRTTRRRGADEADAPAQASTAPAAAAAEAPARAESPAGTTGGSRTPRLATTALLFQAPDLSAARRPRRAQAPAGPPRPHEAEQEAAEPAREAPAQREPAQRESAQRAMAGAEAAPVAETRPSGRRRRAATRPAASPDAHVAPVAERAAEPAGTMAAEPTAEPAATEPAAAAATTAAPHEVVPADVDETFATGAVEPVTDATPQFLAAELSEDDAAAAEEVGLIESELLAEGVELADLAPEDFEELEEEDEDDLRPVRRRRRRGGRGRRGGRVRDGYDDESDEDADEREESDEPGSADEEATAEDEAAPTSADEDEDEGDDESGSRRRRRRRRGTRGERAEAAASRTRERAVGPVSDEVTALKGSTRLEAKRQRRREGRDAGRRRQIITEAEFLARRESVMRSMVVREKDGRTQIAVLEDGVLVEHYVSQQSQTSMAGNVYLGRVQNVLPSMEAAFVDIGKGRNAVLYAGEVNWDAAGLEGQPRRIEQALKSGDSVLVQVTKDPIGHKGARLTSQVTLAGRYLVFVPGGGMTGISRKLPDTERNRLKKILREVVPEGAGVIVRTAAEGASEDELRADVERLQNQWTQIEKKSKTANAPALLQGEPDLAIRVVRDIFNDDFSSLVVQGDGAWDEISSYVDELAPDLRERVSKWAENTDVFVVHRVDEQLAKGMDRKVWLPSGGSLVIDRTEAMTVVDVNTGKFTGAGGTLEETVTRNNLEAAEEIVRQLRLRDIGGIIVIDFIDMVLESNRDLVLRRLVECLGRDRTKHQVAEVTSLGLVQMTRKRVGQGLVEAFSETCEHCHGRGFIVHEEPIERGGSSGSTGSQGAAAPVAHGSQVNGAVPEEGRGKRRKRGAATPVKEAAAASAVPVLPDERSEAREAVKATLATIAAAAAHAHETRDHEHASDSGHAASADPSHLAALAEAVGGTPVEEPADLVVQASTVDADATEAFVEDAVATQTGAESEAEAEVTDAPEAGSDVGQGGEPPKGAGDEVA